MKKLIIIALLTLVTANVFAIDRKQIKRESMPKSALKYVQDNFNNVAIRSTVQVTDGSKISYEVRLVDETLIVFNRDGGVRSVKAETEVAEGAIPWGVRYHVKNHCKGHKVVQVVKTLEGYICTLDNGKEIKCDLNGNVIN